MVQFQIPGSLSTMIGTGRNLEGTKIKTYDDNNHDEDTCLSKCAYVNYFLLFQPMKEHVITV